MATKDDYYEYSDDELVDAAEKLKACWGSIPLNARTLRKLIDMEARTIEQVANQRLKKRLRDQEEMQAATLRTNPDELAAELEKLEREQHGKD